ncbi:hypothetical protein [Ekhidna sp.]|uniref:hypothetical protein n=1 Tax=Ekhidna sp. TaxID=2608089 RepID=UPI003B511806
MRDNFLVIFIFLLVSSCSDENLPPGLYDYQVERLLTNDSSKLWIQVINSQECSDSIKMLIESQNDSLDIFNISPTLACDFLDTAFLGRANASQREGSILFDDSIVFSNGNYWIIDEITSDILTVNIGEQRIKYISN